jgi:hypothetical protein
MYDPRIDQPVKHTLGIVVYVPPAALALKYAELYFIGVGVETLTESHQIDSLLKCRGLSGQKPSPFASAIIDLLIVVHRWRF